MEKAWRIALWIALSVLVVGLVLAGVGWLTGASVPRIVDLAFGGRAGLLARLETARALLTWTLDKLLAQGQNIF